MKNTNLYLISLSAFLLLFAGVMRDDVNEAVYTQLAAQKQFNCVGRVLNNDKAVGSCVLIGKRYVLSAAHVFMSYITRSDTVVLSGQKVAANVPIGAKPMDITACHFEFGGKIYQGKSIKIYTNYHWQKQSFDLALIELNTDVAEVTPAVVNMLNNEAGAEVTGVGFGASGYAGKPQTVVQIGKKIAGQNTVDSLGGLKLNGLSTTLICDFDSPERPELNRIGSAMPRKLEYISAGGDSGGGMFRQRKGKWELIGICHGQEAGMATLMKNGYYGLLMEFTRVSVFSNWIKQNME